jgi:hypothetical protein
LVDATPDITAQTREKEDQMLMFALQENTVLPETLLQESVQPVNTRNLLEPNHFLTVTTVPQVLLVRTQQCFQTRSHTQTRLRSIVKPATTAQQAQLLPKRSLVRQDTCAQATLSLHLQGTRSSVRPEHTRTRPNSRHASPVTRGPTAMAPHRVKLAKPAKEAAIAHLAMLSLAILTAPPLELDLPMSSPAQLVSIAIHRACRWPPNALPATRATTASLRVRPL